MGYPPSTPLRDVTVLSPEARELLRKWCARAVTVEDYDATPVRISFATMIACKERTLAARIYKQLGLAPLKVAYQDEANTTGCLYVRASLADVRAALVAAYERHGLAELPTIRNARRGSHKPQAAPRTEWREDVVVVQPDDDGFVAVGSREWELAFPGSNALAVELSRAAPVLALTSGPAFDEISVYSGGKLLHAWVPRGKRTYRSTRVSKPLTVEMLEKSFGTQDRWQELAGEELMASFEHQGFWSEIESIFDSYAHGPPVPMPEVMAFAKPKRKPAAKKPAALRGSRRSAGPRSS